MRRMTRLWAVAVAAALLGLSVAPAFAQGPPPDIADPCGGYGAEFAHREVEDHNAELGRRRVPGIFVPRETEDGRVKVWKEECSKLDLMRDLHAGWRFASLLAGGFFMLACAYAGILLMVERLSGNGNGQARQVIAGSIIGLLVVVFAMAIWRSMITQVFGLSDLDLGYFNPFGMS